MSVNRRGRGAEWVSSGVCSLALAAALAIGMSGEAAAETCVGDCNGDLQVTIDELVRGVRISLGDPPVSVCPAFDPNLDLAVQTNELVAGVTAALQGCTPPITFRGSCLRPGPSGLVPCAGGSSVRLFLCLDRSRCLFDASARRLLRGAAVGADGRFSFFVGDPALLSSLLLLEADVESGVVYRGFGFGPPAGGGVLEGLRLDPATEAAVRILNENGLHLFTNLGLLEILEAIFAALSNLTFAGLNADAAAQLAAGTARDNPTVQAGIASRRFTPTATTTRTETPTQTRTNTPALTSTPTLSATITLTPTVTLSPTVTPTHTATRTATQTFTATETRTATATVTLTRTVTATLPPSPTPTITPTFTITATPTPTLPPLNLAIEINPDPVRPGETLDASFTVTNTGGTTLFLPRFEIVLPANIEPFLNTLATGAGRCAAGSIHFCNPGGKIEWLNLGTLTPGDGVTVRIPPIVAAGTPNGSELVFTATVSDSGLSNTQSYTAIVQSGAAVNPFDLGLNSDADPVAPGDLLTYTAAFGFRAVVGQADTALRIEPPSGTSIVETDDGGVVNDEGQVEWDIGALTPGQGGIRRLTVRVDETLPLGTPLRARATIRRKDGSGEKRANSVTRARAPQPVSLSIEANADPGRQGEEIELGITVRNTGAGTANVNLELVAPDLVDTLVDIHATIGAVCGAASLGNNCERRDRVRWSLSIPPRDAITVRAHPIVSAGTLNGSLVPFQARLVFSPFQMISTTARHAVRVDSNSIWDLSLDEDRDPAGPLETLTYRAVVRHRPSSPNPVNGVLELVLPDGVTLLDASDDGVAMADTVLWDLGALLPGEVLEREATVLVDGGLAPATLLAAEARIREADASGREKRSRILTRVVTGVPLTLSSVVQPDPVRRGEALETELTVTNVGTSNLIGPRIEARLPGGTEAFAPTLSEGNPACATNFLCSPRTLMRWNTSTLIGGDSASVRMAPIVGMDNAEGSLLRLHAVVYETIGAGGRNAMISRTIVVDGTTPYDLALTDSRDPVPAGQLVTYGLNFGRRAATDSSPSVLRLELPPGAYFVSATGGGTSVAEDLVEWDLGPIAVGQGGRREVTVIVDDLPEGTPLRARATIEDAGDPTTAKRAYAVTAVQARDLVFSVDAGPDPVLPGAATSVSFSVTNNRATAANNLEINAMVPPEAHAFNDNTTTGGGRCGAFTFNACNPRQLVLWLVSVPAGQTVTVTMPPIVRADVPPGSVVRLVGSMREPSAPRRVLAVDAVTVGAGM